jgi:hypothetical protein
LEVVTIAGETGGNQVNKKGFIVPAGGGSVLNTAPRRFDILKLLREETGDSVMLFQETTPAGTDSTTLHLHHDCDEIAYVLSGEMTIQNRGRGHGWRTRNLRLHTAWRSARMEEHRRRNRSGAVSLQAGRCRWVLRGIASAADRVIQWA